MRESKDKIGRNDACPCGSGKKYKRCCLAEDRRRESEAIRLTAASDGNALAEADYAPIPSLAKSLRRMVKHADPRTRAEAESWIASAELAERYGKRLDEIEAALEELEAHADEWHRVMEDDMTFAKRAEVLFTSERFVRLQFTAAEVRTAVEKEGLTRSMVTQDLYVDQVSAAMLRLATKEWRHRMAMELMLELPDLVAAGRWGDGWILVDITEALTQSMDSSNAFIFGMFLHGYDAWQREVQAANDARLLKLGFDPERLRGMSVDELESWYREQLANPQRRALLEEALASNPERNADAEALFIEQLRNSLRVFDRPDAAHLLLDASEVSPWESRFEEQVIEARSQEAPAGESEEASDWQKQFVERVVPLLGEMANGIFSPERRQRLLGDLRAYRNQLAHAGEKEVSLEVEAARIEVESVPDPARSRFLLVLCFRSLARQSSQATTLEAVSDRTETGESTAPPRTERDEAGAIQETHDRRDPVPPSRGMVQAELPLPESGSDGQDCRHT